MSLTVESWIEALESGKYEKGTGALRANDGCFCCLGVACDVSGMGRWEQVEWGCSVYAIGRERDDAELPNQLRDHLGLETADGAFDVNGLSPDLKSEIEAAGCEFETKPVDVSLLGLNDAGVPFPLIAKVIRARPKGLFREADAA
jgi:hypothetical protein